MSRILCSLFIFISWLSAGQSPTASFQAPLDIPLVLSGTFGELRSNHFHAGIDIKTQGVQGKLVRASESGYISRIKVSAYGYGKAIYVTHPNGYTTVYAHLQRYNTEIQKYIESLQYKNQSYEVEAFPKKSDFPVKKGDVIALSGNSGGSGGPHLHFEIRDTKTEKPVNPLLYNFLITDHKSPEFFSLRVSPIGNKSWVNTKNEPSDFKVVKQKNGDYSVSGKISAHGPIGFAAGVIDRLDGANNRNGIYSLTQVVDGDTTYQFIAKTFSFSESRFINAHMDYELKMCCNRLTHRTYLLPGNDLSLYRNLQSSGEVYLMPSETKKVDLYAADVSGNTTKLSFSVYGDVPGESPNVTSGISVNYERNLNFSVGNFSLFIPKHSLYQSIFLPFSIDSTNGYIGPAYHIGKNTIPSHKYFTVEIPVPENTPSPEKLVMVSKSGRNWVYEGGQLENDKIFAKSRTFGVFSLAYDSVPPVILPRRFHNGSSFSRGQRIQVIIKDNLSGIKTYKAQLNKEWILMEYEYKSQSLTYTIPNDIEPGNKTLVVQVTDGHGNENSLITQIHIK